MKKTILIVAAVIIIILAGYFIFAKKNQVPADNSQKSSSSSDVKDAVKSSLLGLMQGATGVKCSVEDATGKYTVISKNNKVRIEGMNYASPSVANSDDQKGIMINDGTWAYIWNGKEGTKFNIKEIEAANAPQGEATAKSSDWQDWAKSMETSGAKYDCQPGLATDADFTPPSDVKFQDLGEMMKAVQQLQNNPGSIDPSQFQTPQ